MECLVNGQPIDHISVADRGLQYGDGLFETIAVTDCGAEFWDRHMARLKEGCNRLGIPAPDPEVLEKEAVQVCPAQGSSVLKISMTRGEGGRGYKSLEPVNPTRIVAAYPPPSYPGKAWQEGVNVRICQTPLGANPRLAGIKHLNRLEQVLARQEWDDDFSEGIMLDSSGNAVEGVMTNLFLVKNSQLYTPDLSNCGVAGIMRQVILEIAEAFDIRRNIQSIPEAELFQADEVFLSNSVIGIWPVKRLGEQLFNVGCLTQQISAEINLRRKTETLSFQ